MSANNNYASSFSLTVALYIAMFVSLFYSIALTRVISVEAFGMIGMGNGYLEILLMISTLGSLTIIQTYSTYYLSRREYGVLKYIIVRYSSIIVVASAILAFVTITFSRWISLSLYNTDLMNLPLKIVGIYILADALLRIVTTLLKSSKQFTLFGNIQILTSSLNFLLTIGLLLYVKSYVSADDAVLVAVSFIGSILSCLVSIIIIVIWNHKGMRVLSLAVMSKPINKNLLLFGGTSASLLLISMSSVHINRLAIGFFLPPIDWGLYYIATVIVNIVLVCKTSLSTIIYPNMVSAHSRGDYEGFNRTIHSSFKYWTLIFVPIMITFSLYISYVIPVVWGSAYSGATLTAQVMIVSFAIQFYGSVYSSAMTAIEKPQRQLIPTIAYIAMNLLFSIPLVYYFGIIGAALTILIANVTNVIISRYIFTREKGIIEAGIHDKYSMVILKTLTVQLTISIISFIPIYFIIETIASIYIQFALALFFGIFVSIIITMYLFARGAIQEDESEKFFSILPKFLRPLARKYRLLSRRVWGSR